MAVECAIWQWVQLAQQVPAGEIAEQRLMTGLASDDGAGLARRIGDEVMGPPIEQSPPQLNSPIAHRQSRKRDPPAGIVAAGQQMRRESARMLQRLRPALQETIK